MKAAFIFLLVAVAPWANACSDYCSCCDQVTGLLTTSPAGGTPCNCAPHSPPPCCYCCEASTHKFVRCDSFGNCPTSPPSSSTDFKPCQKCSYCCPSGLKTYYCDETPAAGCTALESKEHGCPVSVTSDSTGVTVGSGTGITQFGVTVAHTSGSHDELMQMRCSFRGASKDCEGTPNQADHCSFLHNDFVSQLIIDGLVSTVPAKFNPDPANPDPAITKVRFECGCNQKGQTPLHGQIRIVAVQCEDEQGDYSEIEVCQRSCFVTGTGIADGCGGTC